MSQLNTVKQQIIQVSNDTKTTAGGLSSFSGKFSSAINQVEASIGGTAKGTDKQLIATLQAAEKQVKAAIDALNKASADAKKWAEQA